MKNSFLYAITLVLLLTSCGHNVLTNYEVKGLDLSVPIFGYPFGVRIGVVKANQNLLRGDSTYTIHSNTGTEIGSGTVQETQVIQFSANTQINEGNIEKIIRSDEVSDEVKAVFIEKYLSNSKAPVLHPASTNTPTTVTASGDDPKIHERQFETSKSSIWSVGSSSLLKKAIEIAVNFVLLTSTGKVIAVVVSIILIYIAIRILYWIIRWLIRLAKR